MSAAKAADQIQFLQLYVEKDRDASKATVEKANELGFSGLFLTVRLLDPFSILCSLSARVSTPLVAGVFLTAVLHVGRLCWHWQA